MAKFEPHHGTSTENPILTDTTEFENWAEWFGDRPWVYIRTLDGTITKVYRSYSDYCDD